MGDSIGQDLGRGIGSQLEYFEGVPPQKIGHDGDRERVQIARWSGERDDAAALAPASELQAQVTDQSLGDRGRPVLLRDRDISAGPTFPDGAERRHDQLGQDPTRIEAAIELTLHEPPGPGTVTGQHAALQPFCVRPCSRRTTTCLFGRGAVQGVHVDGANPPFGTHTGCRQPPLPDVAVGRHVMHAEPVRSLLQRHRGGPDCHRGGF